jgi:hypothetical protein
MNSDEIMFSGHIGIWGFLSQFARTPFTVDGLVFKTAEQ